MIETDWHHAPLHRFVPGAVHMITAGTLHKEPFFHDGPRLKLMQTFLLERMEELKWKPHAWACFSNHYHFIASVPEEGNLAAFIRGLHSKLAIGLNRVDHVAGRKVMYQYWDTCITFDDSYYARLNYVMHNPVKHGLVSDAERYPYCSLSWFKHNNSSGVQNKVASYKYDRVNEKDDF
jgi:putative transposase